jgi:hypothetical protein
MLPEEGRPISKAKKAEIKETNLFSFSHHEHCLSHNRDDLKTLLWLFLTFLRKKSIAR